MDSTTPTAADLRCLVTWPTDRTAGDLMPDYIRPQHRCALAFGHVREVQDRNTLDEHGRSAPTMVPHRCHCGAWHPVRDVEPAAAP